jgi:hypothetical protein
MIHHEDGKTVILTHKKPLKTGGKTYKKKIKLLKKINQK